ncbi:hypothetical protein SLE2022_330630 [Rubroshorea leprosula]
MTLVGKGLIFVEGSDWVWHKRIMNPAFSLENFKAKVKRTAACAITMLEEWEDLPTMTEDGSKKIEMSEEFKKLSADIIAHTAFGGNYTQGKVFQTQIQFQRWCNIFESSDIFISGSQYLPTPSNFQIRRLDRKIKRTLRQIIENKVQNSRTITSSSPDCFGDDLLGVMIASSEATQAKGDLKLNMNEIMEECKTFFISGHETTRVPC